MHLFRKLRGFDVTKNARSDLLTRVGKPSDTCRKRFWHVSKGFRNTRL